MISDINREHILQAILEVDDQPGIASAMPSQYYDVLYKGKRYPPKVLISLAHQFFNGERLDHNSFRGGQGQPAFEQLEKHGFKIIKKNEDLVGYYFKRYLDYCKRSAWLKYREAYKFSFAKWLHERVDFDLQSDEEILELCKESQEQNYSPYEWEQWKGVNFIVTDLRYSSEFITLKDIRFLRQLHEEEFDENSPKPDIEISLPKIAIWAATLIPERYQMYRKQEFEAAAFLTGENDYPKTGSKAFIYATDSLLILRTKIVSTFESDIAELVEQCLDRPIELTDYPWITQDFLMYVHDKELHPSTAYYWVNQGSNYTIEYEGGYLWAPIGRTHHHKRLRDLSEGDVVVNFSNDEVVSTCTVNKEFVEAPRPNGKDLQNGFLVEVEYSKLYEKIPEEKAAKILSSDKSFLPSNHKAFTADWKANQGYLYEFTAAGFEALFNQESDEEALVIEDPKIEYQRMRPKNTILFGPPGTGKTYSTLIRSMEIIDDQDYSQVSESKLSELKTRFSTLMNAGQIEFVTFHQSFSYEDFIEGIKPVMNEDTEDELKYEITDGVFKRISKSAGEYLRIKQGGTAGVQIDNETLEKAHFHKVTLGNPLNPNDQETYEYCIENNCIPIGAGVDHDFSNAETESDILEEFKKIEGADISNKSYTVIALKCLKFWMKAGNIVFIARGNKEVRAIGMIDGDYEYRKESPIGLHQFRGVKWLYTDLNLPVQDIYENNFMSQAVYSLYDSKIKRDFLRGMSSSDISKPYVLVIDEINRGNVANIFGELITLIEGDKRKDEANEIRLRLPYSKELFSVPSNLYLLGTMNTADRSVEALDTALRRRFSFVEMPPKYDFPEFEKTVHGVKIKDLLLTINGRIQKLLDKDHLIGHAYFLKVNHHNHNERAEQLKDVLHNKILPLLQEYFYGDFGKIGLVMGKGFFEQDGEDAAEIKFADFEHDAADQFEDRRVLKIANLYSPSFDLALALKELMSKP